jgi:hypothetical protein
VPAYLGWICRGVLVAVFAISALSKVHSASARAEFRRATGALARLPERWTAPVAALVVLGESAVPLGLASAGTAPFAFAIAAALLTAFSAALVRAVRSGETVACRCFGGSSPESGPATVIRNCVLLTVSAVGLWCTWSAAAGPLPVEGLLVCAVAVLVLAAGLIRFERIVALFTVRL